MATPSLEALLLASSRTFAVGIERLPPGLREAVRVAYLLLRISDYLEDHPELEPEAKAELLTAWERVLAGRLEVEAWRASLTFGDAPEADALVALHADRVVEALRSLPSTGREIIVRHVRDSTRGMARWALRGPRVEDEAALDDYMHEVAGRVGHLLTELFAAEDARIRGRSQRMMSLGREFGLGLQTVNVIRGLRADHERGWIFVPESMVAPLGLSREQLFDPAYGAEALRVVGRLADKAARHLEAAIEYVRLIPRRRHAIRLFCLYPLLFAVRTLAISRDNPTVLRGEAKITRDEVARIVRAANVWGWSNGWVKRYARRLAEQPGAGGV